MYKIHFPLLEDQGRSYLLILEGLQQHPKIELCSSPNDADFIFLDFRHFPKYTFQNYSDKVVMIDYRDDPFNIFRLKCLLYFKRSCVDKKYHKLIETHVIPISYAIMDNFIYSESPARDIDVGCYFEKSFQNQRNKLLDFIKKFKLEDIKIKHGLVSSDGEKGRRDFSKIYYYFLKRTKILLTHNPDKWEGDSRLWEALANGCLVFIDKMFTPIVNPLIDEKHVIYYTFNNLEEKLLYYLQNEKEGEQIANQGCQFGLKNHRSVNRIDEIIKKIEEIV
jgi:hypothetical protein